MNVLTFDSKNQLKNSLKLLKHHEIEFDNFHNITKLEKNLLSTDYDLFIFHLHTSDDFWIDSINKIREYSNKPIILIAEYDKLIYLSAIEAGVTCFINKSFSNHFLNRIIQNFLKEPKNIYLFKDFTFVINSDFIVINNNKIYLTKTESSILNILIKNKDSTIPLTKLSSNVFQEQIKDVYKLYFHIKNLKKKLGIYKNCIKNTKSVGYSWNEEK